jgi:hypothetical protein
MTRPRGLYRAETNPTRFAELWADRDTPVEAIMVEFGYGHRWSVYAAAQRLGLPRRKRGSRSDYRTPAQREATRRAQLKSLEVNRERQARKDAETIATLDARPKRNHQGWKNKSEELDAHGERVSLPPGVVRFACEGCGFMAASPLGHPNCQHLVSKVA